MKSSPQNDKPLEILFLCNKPQLSQDACTIVDHIEAFEQYSSHRIHLFSNLGEIKKRLDLNRFDALIIHYSSSLLYDTYIGKNAKQRIAAYKGLKVVFVQDEYRQINKMRAELKALQIDVLFTCFPETEIEAIYGCIPSMSKYNNLTGYVPERFTKIQNQLPIHARPLHLGYRGRKLPYWYGALSYEKWNIVEQWASYLPEANLKVDLSYHEKDRLYGQAWIGFLSSCKATLGVESGASVMDFTGELEQKIEAHQWQYPKDTFHTVQEKYLLNLEGKHKLNQISPRCFEAIALKTALVLYEGEYSGILIPDKHYIPLKKDFSNIQTVVEKLQDDDFLQAMADRAFNDIALNPQYGYPAFIHRVDEILSSEFLARHKMRCLKAYTPGEYQKASRPHFFMKCKQHGLKIYPRLPFFLRWPLRMIFRPASFRPYLVYLINHLRKQ